MTIFFDVDGVLNCEADWQRPFTINKRCVRAFAHIVEKLQKRELVQLVIISTWRAGIGKEDDSPQMKNLKDCLAEYSLTIVGSTPDSAGKTREEEIKYYIRRNNVKRYLILDDDESLYDGPKKIPLYIVNYKTGLTEADVKPVLKTTKLR